MYIHRYKRENNERVKKLRQYCMNPLNCMLPKVEDASHKPKMKTKIILCCYVYDHVKLLP